MVEPVLNPLVWGTLLPEHEGSSVTLVVTMDEHGRWINLASKQRVVLDLTAHVGVVLSIHAWILTKVY